MSKYEYDKTSLPFGHSAAIQDAEVINHIQMFTSNMHTILNTDNKTYIDTFLNWINRSSNHKLIGLDDFKYAVYSNGTTEAFEKFYWNNKTRRFRCFKGEYLYHKLAWRNTNWQFIEDANLDKNDAVVISLPFADTGNAHENLDDILHQCDVLNIPVLIDACYFGISKDMTYNFNHSCITDITFSLSKVFPVAHARIGLRLTREDTDDLLLVYHKHSYNNRVGAQLGTYLMNQFDADYIYKKYRKKQIEFCNYLGVKTSNTVLFGIGDRNWQQYNRGTTTNRLGFQKYLHLSIEEFSKINN